MSDSVSFFARFRNRIRRFLGFQEDLPLMHASDVDEVARTAIVKAHPKRVFPWPWSRRSAALAELQAGFSTVTELMSAVRDHLDNQARRQDELLAHLGQLAQALQTIPENAKLQSESMRGIQQQITFQTAQHRQLSEILRKINDSGANQQQLLDALRDRVETLYLHDQAITENMQSVGEQMQTVSKDSQANTQVISEIRDSLVNRDTQLERLLQKQASRLTALLITAMVLSILAILAVVILASSMKGSSAPPPAAPAPAVLPATVPATMPATAPSTIPTEKASGDGV